MSATLQLPTKTFVPMYYRESAEVEKYCRAIDAVLKDAEDMTTVIFPAFAFMDTRPSRLQLRGGMIDDQWLRLVYTARYGLPVTYPGYTTLQFLQAIKLINQVLSMPYTIENFMGFVENYRKVFGLTDEEFPVQVTFGKEEERGMEGLVTIDVGEELDFFDEHRSVIFTVFQRICPPWLSIVLSTTTTSWAELEETKLTWETAEHDKMTWEDLLYYNQIHMGT